MSLNANLRTSVICFLFSLVIIACICDARIRYRYLKRAECRDNWPRRQNDLPPVVLMGLVDTVYPATVGSGGYYGALIHVKWVFRGPKRLQETRITANGFGDSLVCHSDVHRLDSWIFTLDEESDGSLRLNGTLHKVNLHNLDRIKALTRDEPYRKRPDITELPCESEYCENNGNCIEESSGSGGILTRAKCRCLDSCAAGYEPVCGSNGETFPNECRIRMDSCLRGQNYFVRFTGACETSRRPRYVLDQLAKFSH